MDEKKLIEHLKNICEKENIKYEIGALKVICKISEGCVRDASSLLDQAAIYCNNNITTEKVREFLGIASTEDINTFLKALLEGNIKFCMEKLEELNSKGINLHNFLNDIYELIFNALKSKKLNLENEEIPQFLKNAEIEKLLYLEQLFRELKPKFSFTNNSI